MAPGIGASGFAGLALETESGTYVAPTKFFPFMSESMTPRQATVWRRPIRQSADIIGAVPGNFHVEGEISIEALDDVVVYFLLCARAGVVKTGSASPWTYTFTPTAAAIPTKTMSLTFVKNGVVFGYTGCVVSSFTFTIEEGRLMFNVSIIGRNEASQSLPTPTWPTTTGFGAGMYTVEIPDATTVTDTDTLELTVNDNATPQFRLQGGGERGAAFVAYGERTATLKVERDFESRTDYDAWKALTAQAITFTATNTVNHIIEASLTTAIKDTYEVTIGGQGDLIRASVTYNLLTNASGVSYTVAVTTTEDITVS